MPAQHRGQASDECGKQCSVGPVQAGLGVGSAEYGDLVAQDEELDVLRRRWARSSVSQLSSWLKIR
jgi:hypothetical protein